MTLNKTYEEIQDVIPSSILEQILDRGTNSAAMRVILENLGLQEDKDFVSRVYLPSWGTVQYTKNILWGRRAIVSCHSMNNAGGFHFVYYDGDKVFDPSTKLTYESWDDVEPYEIWLFKDHTNEQ